jgi:hypothetical protein
LNAFAATWNTGASAVTYSGGVWTQNAAVSYDAGGTGYNYVTFTVPLSSLGLSAGSQFYFDVVSSYPNPVGQSAYGSLDNTSGYPAESDSSWTPWAGNNYYDPVTDAGGTTFGTGTSLYTVVIPEPGTLALLGGGLMIVLMTQRRRARE